MLRRGELVRRKIGSGTVIPKTSLESHVDLIVEDSSGVALQNELVIVQDLHNQEHEVLRVLSDKNGRTLALDLQPGLYRAIATAPY